MIEIHHTAVAGAPVAVAFDYVDDYHHVPSWLFGITRFDPIGEQDRGLGAVYDAAMKIGPKTLGSVVKVTGWEQNALIELEADRRPLHALAVAVRGRRRDRDPPDGRLPLRPSRRTRGQGARQDHRALRRAGDPPHRGHAAASGGGRRGPVGLTRVTASAPADPVV